MSLNNLGDYNFIVNVPDEDYYAVRQADPVQARRRDRRRERRQMRGGLVRGGHAVLAAESVEDEDDGQEDEAEAEENDEATAAPSSSGAQYGDIGSSYYQITDIGQSSGIQYGDVGNSQSGYSYFANSGDQISYSNFASSGEETAYNQYVTPYSGIYHPPQSPLLYAAPHMMIGSPRPTFNNEPTNHPIIDFQTESPSNQYGMGLDLQLAPPTAPEPIGEGGDRPLRRSSRQHVAPSCGTHSRIRY